MPPKSRARSGLSRLFTATGTTATKDASVSAMGRLRTPWSIARQSRDFGATAVVIGPVCRSRRYSLDVIFVENVLDDPVRRTIVPARVVIEVEPYRRDRSRPDIRATPAA